MFKRSAQQTYNDEWQAQNERAMCQTIIRALSTDKV